MPIAFTRIQKPDPGLPGLPITDVVEENGGLLALSYSDVFRVDKGRRTAMEQIRFCPMDCRARAG